jgi:hypothetical protein
MMRSSVSSATFDDLDAPDANAIEQGAITAALQLAAA